MPVVPYTRSPGVKEVTPSPRASTSPANSWPRMRRRGRTTPNASRMGSQIHAGNSKRRISQSALEAVVAWTRTSTSPAFGRGVSTSSSLRTSGPP